MNYSARGCLLENLIKGGMHVFVIEGRESTSDVEHISLRNTGGMECIFNISIMPLPIQSNPF